MIEGLVR